jgi:hypothetical protein
MGTRAAFATAWFVIIHGALALAQSPGAFVETGNMSTPRELHTATLLNNGKVLIAGGRTRSGPCEGIIASAELYDPTAGSFTPTGAMMTPRRSHTATLLPDGKVVVAGGYTSVANRFSVGRLAGAELYDPSTGTFTPTGSMLTTHACHSGTLLGNGKVLFAGDSQDLIGHSAITELYDPTTGTFAATGTHADPRGDSLLCPWTVLLPDGKVLIASDCDSAELFDPSEGTLRPTGRSSLCTNNAGTAVPLPDGRVLAVGSEKFEGGPDNRAQLYDPSGGAFTDTGGLITGRFILTATALPDGTPLIARAHGGRATSELYDPVSGSFRFAGDLISAYRDSSTATLLADGSVLIAGGPGNSRAERYWPPFLTPPPVLLSVSGEQGAVLHAGSTRLVSATDPARAGETIEVYATGLIDEGVIPPQVAIGGRLAEVLFFGKAPGLAALNQINVRVRSGVSPRPATVPVRMTYLSRPSNEVTIGVQDRR